MQEDVIWQTVLGEVELTISRAAFVTWFKNTRLVKYSETSVTIGVPNIFAKQQFEVKFRPLIAEILQKNNVSVETIEFKIISSIVPRRSDQDRDNETVILNQDAPSVVRQAPAIGHSYRQGLNERYTFDNFIVGSGSELAYAACQAIAANPGLKYNPLFVYGGVGIGKTHLIQAVGNAILASNSNAKVVYISSEQFVQEFLDAIRYKKIADFAGHYRSADVLIVDDMQFIAGKEKTQEEFFHTFNALHQANKQIIISSDKPPHAIPTLEDRLKSRFAMGMTVDMQAPDYETRCAILQSKSIERDFSLSSQVVDYLANHIQSNVRELEGALNHLLAFCEMRNLEPELALVQSLFGSLKSRPKHITAKQVIEKTSRHFQLPIEDVTGPKRDKDIVCPRQIAMYLLRSELHMSFPKIAAELGRKDHTTAIHSVEKIERELQFDTLLKQHVSEIKEKLYA